VEKKWKVCFHTITTRAGPHLRFHGDAMTIIAAAPHHTHWWLASPLSPSFLPRCGYRGPRGAEIWSFCHRLRRMVKGAMIAAAAAVPSAIWQWCTQLMAPRLYMGSDESMVVWFGSADVGSAVVDANRLIMGICREINSNKLQLYLARMTWRLQIMALWPLIVPYDLLVVWFGGGVVSSICSGRRMVPPTWECRCGMNGTT